MHFFEQVISQLSSLIWAVFLPVLLIVAIIIAIKFFGGVKKQTTRPSKLDPRDIVGPAAISMGAMIGTGAIIGVLGSMMSLVTNGQVYFEAIAGWSVIGALVLIPLCYIETLVCKITNMTPKNYIAKFLNPKLGAIYAYAFILLYVFGFGGFQVQGINSAITIIVEGIFDISASPLARYIVLVLPLIIIVSAIVLAKKHDVFINSMALMIGAAVIMYLVMVIIFIAKTSDYVPVYVGNILAGMKNPISAGIGLPIGFTVAVQRITQTSEPGLGALAMSSLDSDSEPTAAGLISLIPAITTVFIAIFVTSYITSYGVSAGIVDLQAGDSLVALKGYFLTCFDVVGMYGLVTITLFTVLSGITSLLGSYYFLSVLLDFTENQNIAIYISLILIAGTLAVFGGSIIFEAVDLLMFVVTGTNLIAILLFATKHYNQYKILD
ncbi:hypothetical protein R2F61_05400 [Mollicutes bacterium LVI A0078]|nr:hypothetical protein RZE84_05420 [Mollicutes bacterium LVI A0075]WOO90165.1 hypothetical protein R2F61_05400 [Mollicutes bacterium LVI A0078]